MSILTLYATGHRRLYSSDEEEVRAITGENARERGSGLGTFDPENPRLHWWPSSLDFREEASRNSSRSPIGVGSLQQFLRAIRRRRNLETVLFFGHGGENLLKFGDENYIRSSDVQGRNFDISSHFAQNGRIILYACNSAHSPEFLTALANSLHVRVCGFRNGVRWNVHWDDGRTINWRGIVRRDNNADLPSNYECFSPENQQDSTAAGEQHTHLFQRGVMGGSANRTGQVLGSSRRQGPAGQA